MRLRRVGNYWRKTYRVQFIPRSLCFPQTGTWFFWGEGMEHLTLNTLIWKSGTKPRGKKRESSYLRRCLFLANGKGIENEAQEALFSPAAGSGRIGSPGFVKWDLESPRAHATTIWATRFRWQFDSARHW